MSRIEKLASQVKTHWPLVGMAGNYEAEVILAQTLKASAWNLKERGDAFSFSSLKLQLETGSGLADNPKGLRTCIERGWLEQSIRPEIIAPNDVETDGDGAPRVLVLTDKALDDIAAFLSE